MDHTKTSRRYALLSGSLFLLGSLLFSVPALAAEPSGDGNIKLLRGQVFVNGTRANQNTPVPSNSEVRTGSRSMVAFSAGGDAHVMKSNSTIVLKSSDGSWTSQLRILSGSLLSAWGKRPVGQQAQLQTKTATIGIRGTVTYVGANGTFSVLQGKVEYTNKNGKKTTMEVRGGKLVSVNAAGEATSETVTVTLEEVSALQEAVAADPTLQDVVPALNDAKTNIETTGTTTVVPGTDSTTVTGTIGGGGTASP